MLSVEILLTQNNTRERWNLCVGLRRSVILFLCYCVFLSHVSGETCHISASIHVYDLLMANVFSLISF